MQIAQSILTLVRSEGSGWDGQLGVDDESSQRDAAESIDYQLRAMVVSEIEDAGLAGRLERLEKVAGLLQNEVSNVAAELNNRATVQEVSKRIDGAMVGVVSRRDFTIAVGAFAVISATQLLLLISVWP